MVKAGWLERRFSKSWVHNLSYENGSSTIFIGTDQFGESSSWRHVVFGMNDFYFVTNFFIAKEEFKNVYEAFLAIDNVSNYKEPLCDMFESQQLQ